MIVQKAIGNIDNEKETPKQREWVELDWEELNKRILRKKNRLRHRCVHFTGEGRSPSIW